MAMQTLDIASIRRLPSKDRVALLRKLYHDNEAVRSKIERMWQSIPLSRRKENIASVFIESFLKDMFLGRVDIVLYELYSTNHNHTQHIANLSSTFKTVFRSLLYSKIKLVVNSNGSFTMFDYAGEPWWITSMALSENSKTLLNMLTRSSYEGFHNTKTRTSLAFGESTVWSQFRQDDVLQNAFMTIREYPEDPSSLASSNLLSPRAHLCERMIYLMVLTNIAWYQRILSQHCPSDEEKLSAQKYAERHMLLATVSYIEAALQEIALENMLDEHYEMRPEDMVIGPRTPGASDTPASLHQYVIELLDDLPRLQAAVARFVDDAKRQMTHPPDGEQLRGTLISGIPTVAYLEYGTAARK